MLADQRGQNVVINAEMAETDLQRQRGLMYREHLGDDEGMLFSLDVQQMLNFWMKNTLIPLDVIFFNQRGEFVSSATMEPCASDTCKTYPSEKPAMYALEVPSGFVRKRGIGPGWILKYVPDS